MNSPVAIILDICMVTLDRFINCQFLKAMTQITRSQGSLCIKIDLVSTKFQNIFHLV